MIKQYKIEFIYFLKDKIMIKKLLLLFTLSSTFMIMPTREKLPTKTKEEKAALQHRYYLKRKSDSTLTDTNLPISPRFDLINTKIKNLYLKLRATSADQNLRKFRNEYSQDLKALTAIIPNKSSNKTYKQIYYKAYQPLIKAQRDTPEFKKSRKACKDAYNNAYQVQQTLREIFREITREDS